MGAIVRRLCDFERCGSVGLLSDNVRSDCGHSAVSARGFRVKCMGVKELRFAG